MSEETHYTCGDCGSEDIQIQYWVNPNTRRIMETHPDEYFCVSCGRRVYTLDASDPPGWTVAHTSRGDGAYLAASPERAVAQYLLEGVPAEHIAGRFIVKRTDTDRPFDEVYEIESVEFVVKLREVG